MAAGSFGVARRREIHNYPEKESYYCRKNEGRREETDRHWNKYSSYLGTVRTCDLRDGGGHGRGFVGRSRDWEPVELLSGWRGGRSRDNEISKYEDGVSKLPEKKRKFSPIVWDRDDKGVRISSKNKNFPKFTNGLCCASSLLESFGKLNNVPVTASQLQGFKISPVESHVVDGSVGDCEFEPLPSPTSCSTGSEDLGQLEDDEYVEVRHVSASRWACEENSPGNLCLYDSDHCGDYPAKRKRVDDAYTDLLDTPESGEVCGGGSECSEGKSSTVSDGSGVSNLDLNLEDDKYSSRFQGSASPKPRRKRMLQDFRSVFAYERVNRINEGTYGVVHKARDEETREIVALKKMKMTGLEGDCYSRVLASREINILASLHHPSVVDVKEVVIDKDDVYLVMEYMEYDLKGFIEAMRQPLSEREVKCLMLKLLEGVKYLHDNWILHRDLKASNLLINSNGDLKICDFGMSRQYGTSLKPYTPLVVTLWYRAPELLLGTKQYSTAIDMWSVGCIMAELLNKQPLFNGDSELEQLNKIFGILGTPSETIWPGFSKLPGAKVKFAKQSTRTTLREKFPGFSFWGSPVLSDRGFDLLSRLLTYDPEKRISAEAALKHNWFQVEAEQELVSVQESIACKLKLMTNGK